MMFLCCLVLLLGSGLSACAAVVEGEGLVGSTELVSSQSVYLFSFFRSEEAGCQLAYSYDLYNWTEIPGPHLIPKIGDRVMRDAFIARGPDGIFRMVWTTGWKRRDIGYAGSPDLINWSRQKLIPVMAHKPKAKNCWAPKLFYDERSQQWMILWSTWLDDGTFPPPERPDTTKQNRIFYVTTKDFSNFSEARLLFDPGHNCIDAYLLKDENEYLLFFKDERGNDAEVFNPEYQNIRFARSKSPFGPFGSISKTITGKGPGKWQNEGPSAIKVGAEYYVFYDHYNEKGAAPSYYGAAKSTNLVDWVDVSDQMRFPGYCKHGSILPVPSRIVDGLLNKAGAGTTAGKSAEGTDISSAVDEGSAFRFTVTGDPRDGLSRWKHVLSEITDKMDDEGAFHISAGDYYQQDRSTVASDFYDALKVEFGDDVIWYPCVGNHELKDKGSDLAWIRKFYYDHLVGTVNPGPPNGVETTYSWDYGVAHFVMLNMYYDGTTDDAKGAFSDALYKWLVDDLNKNTKPVVFVIYHEPAYAQGRGGKDSSPAGWRRVMKLLNDRKVVAGLCAHTHMYARYQVPGDWKAFTWEVDVGNAGRKSHADSHETVLDVTVNNDTGKVLFNTWQGTEGSDFHITDSWTVTVSIPQGHQKKTAGTGRSMFAADNTIGLWLFDETQYPHTTLTDASEYEYDLRLQKGGKLVAGRFGNALKVSPGPEHAVSYAGFKGSVPIDQMREKDGTPSGLWGPAVAPKTILSALAGGDWTCEFWLKLASAPTAEVTIVDLGQAYEPGVTVNLAAGATAFEITNSYAGLKALCPASAGKLADGRWHHIAFTRSAASGKFRHFLDGKVGADVIVSEIATQPTPVVIKPEDREHGTFGFSKDKSFEWRRQHRFNFTIGHDRQANKDMTGMVDELRLSDVVRYSKNFTLPGSFSRNYGPNAPKPAVANGLPLLFGQDSPKGPVRLGARKHLFIDDALIDKKQNVRLTCNPPTDRRDLNFRPKKSSWRASVVDIDGKVYMYIPEGYGSEEGITRLRISKDGINFEKPELGVVEYEGSTKNDFVFYGVPFYGTMFRDLNPNISPDEKFKLTAWVANRGIYLYLSPDGMHWRRNETCMLPLVSGGGAETYWDDQRGVYVDFIKRDSSFKTREYPGGGRRACMFETRRIHKAWPFKVLEEPYFEGWPMPAVTGEGPIVFGPNKNGQVYRTRAIKYPWAPDTYVAFVWRFGEGERRQVDLGVSRDGIHWKFYADEAWYMTPGSAEEVLSLYGLIRRGDEIWQYADYGGAHGGSKRRTYARLTQRLDGFVSLDTGAEAGWATTRPLIFKGRRLMLNVAAQGSMRVAILDEKGNELKGFGLADCDPVVGDATSYLVSWQKNTDVSRLAGKVVQLKFEMQDTRLYAFKFE